MLDYRAVLTVRLFALALEMGGAGAGAIDVIFLIAARPGRVTRELVAVVRAAAGMVAGAMGLLAISGVAFFFVGAETSPKFWAKMVIVAIACLNGVAAHRLVFPLIEAASASGTGRLYLRPWSARLAAASAAVSGVSWSAALILGAWRGLQVGTLPIRAVYVVVLTGGILVSKVLVAPRVFVFTPSTAQRSSPTAFHRLRCLPGDVAHALAWAVADRAPRIADRLGGPPAWPVSEPRARSITTPDRALTSWPVTVGAPVLAQRPVAPVEGAQTVPTLEGDEPPYRPSRYVWPDYDVEDDLGVAWH